MRCPKCRGFVANGSRMVGEAMINVEFLSCVNCGQIVAQRELLESGRAIDLQTLRNTQPTRPLCKVDGCDRPLNAHGRCTSHANIALRLVRQYAGKVEFYSGQMVTLLDDVRLSHGALVDEGSPLMVIGVRRANSLVDGVDRYLVTTTDESFEPEEFEVDADLLAGVKVRVAG